MSLVNFNPIQDVNDDGLCIPEVGVWGIEKYNLLGRYAEIFTNSMKGKWGNLVYIDLFASSGYCKIKGTNRIIRSGAMIALSIPISFEKYIFCEEDPDLLNSLRIRVTRDFPEVKAEYICGNSNDKIGEIISMIPPYSKTNTLLSFAFIDPFRLNIHFRTIELLGRLKVDILMLIATGMAATRNERNYVSPSNQTITYFLNDPNWRNKFSGDADMSNQSFTQFLANQIKEKMVGLGYAKASDFYPVRYKLNGKNVILYHLAFFSKHSLGNKFWDIIRKNYAGDQIALF